MAVNLVTVTTITRIVAYQGQPGTTSSTLYTVPASTNVKIVSIVMANTTSSSAIVTINVVPSGNSAAAANQVIPAMSVSGNSVSTLDSPIFMAAGDFIAGLQGTASAITVTISVETYA